MFEQAVLERSTEQMNVTLGCSPPFLALQTVVDYTIAGLRVCSW